jgi:hypothetical protein
VVQAIGSSWAGTWSRRHLADHPIALRETPVLLALGAAAVIFHAATRGMGDFPPGYQGLPWMALAVAGRVPAKGRAAGLTTAFGAAAVSMLPFWGFGDPARWVAYLLAGATLDVGFALLSRWREHIWLLALLGGVAHATKPLLRVEISALSGWPYPSLLAGAAYPTITHFIFGAVGAAIGGGAIIWMRRSLRGRPG